MELTERIAELLYWIRHDYLDERPKTRGDCANFPRPCPFISCRHHIFFSVCGRGIPKSMWLDRDPTLMKHTCSLDIADTQELTLEEIGEILWLTRERVRQIEDAALDKFLRGLLDLGVTHDELVQCLLELDSSGGVVAEYLVNGAEE